MPSSRSSPTTMKHPRRNPNETKHRRRQAVQQEKEMLALEIAILEAELERKRILDAIQKLSDEMRKREESSSSSHHRRQRRNSSDGNKALDSVVPWVSAEKPSQSAPSEGTESVTDGSESTFGSHSWKGDPPDDHAILEDVTVRTNFIQESETIIEEETVYEEHTIHDDDTKSYEEWTVVDEKSCYYEEETVDEGEVDNETENHNEGDASMVLRNMPRKTLHSLREVNEEDEHVKLQEYYPVPATAESSPYPIDSRKMVFFEAASLGRLTRLKEHIVETTTTKNKIEPDSVPWLSAGLLAVETQSLHRCVFQQAVAKGARTKLPEFVVGNYDLKEKTELSLTEIFAGGEDDTPRSNAELSLTEVFAEGEDDTPRSNVKQLCSLFESGSLNNFKTSHFSKDQFFSAKRERRQSRVSARGRSISKDFVTTTLPVPTLPRVQHPSQEPHVSHVDLARQVAMAAWNRRFRTQRPQMFRMRDACRCQYCKTACPQQTYAYQRLSILRNSFSSASSRG